MQRQKHERSTRCRQRSQAAGPIHVKFGGRDSETIPASRKQHSGRQRVKFAGSYSVCPKSRCRNAVHFSKALGINSACGASWLVVSPLAPICVKEQHSSKAWIPNCLQPGASTVRRAKHLRKTRVCRQITVLERCTIWRRWQFRHAASPMMRTPASTCTCRTSVMYEKACGRILSVVRYGTRMALASPFICPLCSASAKHGHEMTVKQLLFRRVFHIGSTNFR